MSTCQRIGLPAGFPRKKTFASTVPGFALPHSALRSLAHFLSTPRTCPSLNFSQLFSQRTVPGQQGNARASPAGEADLWGAGGQGTRRNRGGSSPSLPTRYENLVPGNAWSVPWEKHFTCLAPSPCSDPTKKQAAAGPEDPNPCSFSAGPPPPPERANGGSSPSFVLSCAHPALEPHSSSCWGWGPCSHPPVSWC